MTLALVETAKLRIYIPPGASGVHDCDKLIQTLYRLA